MKKIKSTLAFINLFALTITLLFVLGNCTTEEELIAPEIASSATESETNLAGIENNDAVASFTISGMYTEVSAISNCASCTYVVPANSTIVDGKGLGFAPGSVICLDKAVAYKALEFINMEGTAKSPITISYCGN